MVVYKTVLITKKECIGVPVSMACASSSFHFSATSLAKGSSGFGALSKA